MTKADAARLVAIVVTAYPNFDKFKDAKAIEATHRKYEKTRKIRVSQTHDGGVHGYAGALH